MQALWPEDDKAAHRVAMWGGASARQVCHLGSCWGLNLQAPHSGTCSLWNREKINVCRSSPQPVTCCLRWQPRPTQQRGSSAPGRELRGNPEPEPECLISFRHSVGGVSFLMRQYPTGHRRSWRRGTEQGLSRAVRLLRQVSQVMLPPPAPQRGGRGAREMPAGLHHTCSTSQTMLPPPEGFARHPSTGHRLPKNLQGLTTRAFFPGLCLPLGQ